MTFESTKYHHPSHDWEIVEENDFKYLMCRECYACACCHLTAKSEPCKGWEETDGEG